MKRTIAFIALCSATMAADSVTLETADVAVAGNTGYKTQSGTFTVAMTLDVERMRELLEKGNSQQWKTMIVNYVAGGVNTGVTVNGSANTDQTIKGSYLYARWNTDYAWNPSGGSDVIWSGSNSLADLNGEAEGTGWDEVAYAGLVYSFSNAAGTSVAFTLIGVDGSVIVDSCVSAPGLIASGAGVEKLTFDEAVLSSYYFNSALTEADRSNLANLAATAKPLPEPTTATLSLLALAGLAARRRRR